jgi:CRP-like cAMP-binding protein
MARALVNPSYLNPGKGGEELSRHVPFRGLEKDLLASIYSQGEILCVDAHTNVIVEGEPSSGMFIILEGMVGVYKSESTTRKGNLIKTLGIGQAFGEMSLVDRAPRSATVAAEVDSVLFAFEARAWDRLIASSPELGMLLFQNFALDMSARVRALNEDLIVSQRQLWRYTFSRGLDEHGRKAAEDEVSTA